MTDRLWITDPKRTTCTAQVTAVRGNEFSVDKALFAPRSRACRHPQNHDKGTVWLEGEKRRVASVREAGEVWYSLRGTVPTVGTKLQCQLDQDTRNEASMAHSAMHLVMAHIDVPMIADPEVRGGGHFRLTYAWPVPQDKLKLALAKALQTAAADSPVERIYATKDVASRFLSPQLFQPPDFPGPESLPLVKIGDNCLPCDGSHVDRTGRISSIKFTTVRQGKGGFVVGCRVT